MRPRARSRAPSSKRLEPLRHVDAGVLNIAYYEEGPADGRSRSCCTAFPTTFTPMSTSRRNWRRKAAASSFPICAASARRAFAIAATLRSGEQAAIGADVIALMDALGIQRAVFAGHNWGGRAACVAAALWPERCTGMVTVNSYLIQDLTRAMVPISPQYEMALWYEYYFQTRARAGRACRQPARDREDFVGAMVAGLGFRRGYIRSDGGGARQS